ncbi:MAG: FAD-dependent oxidoreductase [Brooklawnia sp.]|uniref:ferredoxin--NADP reductase n=1 Tax=Brooklawnia sp. TaxID=2699740 RepID=UPI003C796145
MITPVRLLGKDLVANETMAFRFAKPEGFEYRAGQFCDITLIDPPQTDAEGNTRGFSLASAPHEDFLMVATRLRDTAFKRVLRNLPIGTEVILDAPYGDFTLHRTQSRPAVFIIGGIGVTPVRSMVSQASHDRTGHQLLLIHSNRTAEDAPFADEFERLAAANPNFRYVPVYQSPPAGWQQESGRVDEAMLRRHVDDLGAPGYYLSGPAGMVKAMRSMLTAAGVNEDNIRTEEFAGY